MPKPRVRPHLSEENLIGLGEFFIGQRRIEQAEKVFQLLHETYNHHYLYHFLVGKLAFEKKDFDQAKQHFERAKELNPFYQPASIFLSKTFLHQKNRSSMIESLVDAFLLSKKGQKKSIEEFYQQLGPHDFNQNQLREKVDQVFQERKTYFRDLIQSNISQYLVEGSETVEIEIDDEDESPALEQELDDNSQTSALESSTNSPPSEHPGEPVSPSPSAPDSSPSSMNSDLAKEYLAKHYAFKSLGEKDLESMAQYTSVQRYQKDQFIFESKEPIYGIYFNVDGKISIESRNGKGTSQFRLIDQESVFGEIYFFLGEKQIHNARALSDATVIFFNKGALKNIFARNQELSNHFLWHIWKSLNFQLHQYLESLENTDEPSEFSSPAVKDLDQLWLQLEISSKVKFSPAVMSFLQECGDTIDCKENQNVIEKDSNCNEIHIVLEGEVSLEIDQEVVGIVTPGEVFAELALSQSQYSSHLSAKACSAQTKILKIEKSKLIEKMDQNSPKTASLMLSVCKIVAHKIQTLHQSY